MASALNSAPTANASGNANSGSHSGRSTLRPSNSTKGSDNRRQSGSPVDGGARRSNSHKAWTQGTNPITQRSSHSTSNGNMAHRGQSGSPRPNQKESNTPDSHAHDRLVFLFASFIGLQTTITTKAGEKLSGIFSNSTLESNDSSFTLKMVQRADQEDQLTTNGVSDVAVPYLGSGPEYNMQFDIREIADISVPNVTTAEVSAKVSNGASQGFRTDSDISGNLAMRERTLQRWEPSENDVDMSIETSNSAAGWDQFETNERLTGFKSDYNESIYTTHLDRTDPSYSAALEKASRIAAEIEGSASDNSHLREERGLVEPATGDQDEEDKYSGVRREEKAFPPLLSGQPNKYTPPGRRQAAPQPTNAPPKQAAPPASVPSITKKETPTAQQPEPTTLQPSAEIESGSASAKAFSPGPPAVKRPSAENATANVETEVLDHFRQFANSEKLKMQERRRNQASYDRTVKLNELMKFSKSFKLSTPVPKDLVPILAKDRMKQEEIIQRAQQAQQQGVDEKDMPKITSPPTEPKPPVRGTGPTGAVPPVAPADRQNYQRSRQGYPPTGPLAGPNGRFPQQPIQPGRPGVGMLGHRLADNLQQRKGAGVAPVPAPLPIQDARGPPTGPASDQHRITSPVKSQGPGSSASSKFNVRAMEFKPNPAASTFTPGGAPSATTASPRPFSRSRSVSRTATPTAFFGPRKPQPISERPSLQDQFNPIKRMKKEGAGHTEKPYIFNDGIPPPYKTLPTWDTIEGNEEKTYDQMFKQPIVPSSAQGRSVSNNPNIPQQHGMSFHFQQGNPGLPASGGPNGGHLHPQGHHGPPHVDDHRMHMSGSNSGVFPSPRMQPGYPSPMAPPAQVAFGQPMPPFYGNPQGGQMRPYQGGPQFVNPQAPMMVQQPSNGPFMGVPQGMGPYNQQMPMYSPSPAHAYPHAPAPQPHSGYPSPSRGAPMMMHQNSQSGQPPQPMMYMPGHMPPNRGNYPQQPHFSSSPHQSHHFHPNQHRTPSNGFNQMPQMPSQMSSNTPNSGASHSAEATDEGK
ncbi:hypothetical protein N7508_008126 [Penicillium antarcticum]|uniref:uncharacterized protein n=1 Tax=Penicillium antarcticum TaxID=416450 RepID=UPI002392F284|nr:uncharacterized protein N7508_008126 [Penicillium antarcticum]KAJ5297877.1 hypothetical protein N7508_008126 [Penicillium antarcticum]